MHPFSATLRDEHDDAVAWHQPGIAWGRLGGPGQANLVRAEEALPPDPARLCAQAISNAVKKENHMGEEER